MHKTFTTKSSSQLNTGFKLLISVLFIGVVVYQLTTRDDLSALWAGFASRLQSANVWLLVLAILLMPVNWLLESFKWRLLMRPAILLTLATSIKGVLSGVTFSLLTPNRIGQYGGRILFVPPRHNWRAVMATVVGSFSQNLVHVTIGLVALSFVIKGNVVLPVTFSAGISVLLSLIIGGLIVLYFNIHWLSILFQRVKKVPKWLDKPVAAFQYLRRIQRIELSKALFISFCRYVIFCTQFVLLLTYFGAEVPLIWLYGGIAVVYLMHTSIPLPPFVDVMARTELGVLLWAGFGVNELSVFAASFFVWIINLAIPAFMGLLAMSRVNVMKTLGYENETVTPTITDHARSDLGG